MTGGVRRIVALVERLKFCATLPEDVTLDKPGEGLCDLVSAKQAGWDGEDVVQLLQGALFRFYKPRW